MRLRTGLLIALVGLAAGPVGAQAAGSVRGQIALRVEGARLADVGPMVVYLDGVDRDLEYRVPAEIPRISQKDARFAPSFLVIARGQTVDMPNDDTIVHNVFSYSRPNELDLGLYPKGNSKAITFLHSGVVRVYCSIHESMNAVIFVAPSPYHALAGASGAFEIANVPAGRYRLRTWNQMLPEAAREVELAAGKDAEVELPIEAR